MAVLASSAKVGVAMRAQSRSRAAARPVLSRKPMTVVRASAEPPTPTPTPEPVVIAPQVPKSVTIGDAMAFSGPAPEIFNGRMAMLGFLAAVGAELATGESILTQFAEATGPILVGVAVFAVASLVPILKGAAKDEAFGPFTPKAEQTNGRAAMLGIAALLAIELAKGSALF